MAFQFQTARGTRSPDPSPRSTPLNSWLRRQLSCWSLGRKMLAAYGVAFAVTSMGIGVGFLVAKQIERQALAIEAEAVEDLGDISRLEGDLLELFIHNGELSVQLAPTSTIPDHILHEEFIHFAEHYQSFKATWRDFKASDEFGETELGLAFAEPSEAETRIATAILRDHNQDIEHFIGQVDALLADIPPSTLKPEQLPLLREKFLFIAQEAFILKLHDFIEKVVELEHAAAAEKAAADVVLQRAIDTQELIIVSSIVLSGALGFLLVHRLSRFLLQPLRTITEVTQQSIQEANFDLRVEPTSQDEVGRLTQTFNDYMTFVQQLLTQHQATEQTTQTSLNQQLQATLEDLHYTQQQMVQTEKMLGLGQLVAGVAHEINNPVTFIHGNLTHLQQYTHDLLGLVRLYEHHTARTLPEVYAKAQAIDLDFLQEDLPRTLTSMESGTTRIREIVRSLRNFSRLDETGIKPSNIHEGLDSSLVILRHRLRSNPKRPEIEVVRDYASLPMIDCNPGLLNQVFMNILTNAIDALEEQMKTQTAIEWSNDPSKITIKTVVLNQDWVQVAIADNGPGMTLDVRKRIFDPFFTTKEIGKSTGMGLSISYQTVTKRHGGKLEFTTKPGEGTQFFIQVPIRQSASRVSLD